MACRLDLASVIAACLAVCIITDQTVATEWAQFRGPNCVGHGQQHPMLPIAFGPDKNVLWKCPLPHGISSPCVFGKRIFLTAFNKRQKQLQVICVDRDRGKIVWQKSVAAEKIEKVHKSSSPANATAVANEQYVYFYFASCGMFCFDHEGNQVWHHELPCSKRFNGSGTSPILAGDHLILNRDDDRENYLLALDAKTGEMIWNSPHSGRGGFGEATPVVWNKQVVVHRTNEVSAYQLEDGKRVWSLPLNTTAASTPVVEGDALYVAAWNNSGEASQKASLPPYAKIIKQADKDGDGELNRSEMPWGPKLLRRPELKGRKLGADMPVKFCFDWLDANRDGKINESEWQNAPAEIEARIKRSPHGMTAIQLNRSIEGVTPAILWEVNKSVPEVPSPLVVGPHVYMIKNGGILTCIDKLTGKVQYRRRLKTAGPYISSPVAVNDSVITASMDGIITVFRAGEEFEMISSTDTGEEIKATPAIAKGVLYVRTGTALYAFQKR